MVAFATGQTLTASALEARFAALEGYVTNFQNSGTQTTTSTSNTATLGAGSSACGVAFTVPPSGAVRVFWQSEISNTTVTAGVVVFEIRSGGSVGSGTLVVPADDFDSIQHNGTTVGTPMHHTQVTGLTPGSTYNIQMLYRVGAGTGTFGRRRISVEPA